MVRRRMGSLPGLLALTMLVALAVGGCSSDSIDSMGACPVVLKSDTPRVDTPEGRFTLDRVEVWTAPGCFATPTYPNLVQSGDEEPYGEIELIPEEK